MTALSGSLWITSEPRRLEDTTSELLFVQVGVAARRRVTMSLLHFELYDAEKTIICCPKTGTYS